MSELERSAMGIEQEIDVSSVELPQWFIEAETELWSMETKANNEQYYHSSEYKERRLLVEYTRNLINFITEHEVDEVVLLDKSARPITTLLRTAWHLEVGDAPMPHISFINIGKEKSTDSYGISCDGFRSETNYLLNNDQVARLSGDELRKQVLDSDDPDVFEKIHATYTRKGHKHSIFKGKRVLMVDELRGKGRSITLAKRIFELSFGDEPQTVISYYFYDLARDGDKYNGKRHPFLNRMPWHGDETGVIDKRDPKDFLAVPVKSLKREKMEYENIFLTQMRKWLTENSTEQMQAFIKFTMSKAEETYSKHYVEGFCGEERLATALESYKIFARTLSGLISGETTLEQYDVSELIDECNDAGKVRWLRGYFGAMNRDGAMDDWDYIKVIKFLKPYLAVIDSVRNPLEDKGFDIIEYKSDTDYRVKSARLRRKLKYTVLSEYFAHNKRLIKAGGLKQIS